MFPAKRTTTCSYHISHISFRLSPSNLGRGGNATRILPMYSIPLQTNMPGWGNPTCTLLNLIPYPCNPTCWGGAIQHAPFLFSIPLQSNMLGRGNPTCTLFIFHSPAILHAGVGQSNMPYYQRNRKTNTWSECETRPHSSARAKRILVSLE